MKKKLSFLLAIGAIFFMVSCTENLSSVEDKSSNSLVSIIYLNNEVTGDFITLRTGNVAVFSCKINSDQDDAAVSVIWRISRTGLSDSIVLVTTNIEKGEQGIDCIFSSVDIGAVQKVSVAVRFKSEVIIKEELFIKIIEEETGEETEEEEKEEEEEEVIEESKGLIILDSIDDFDILYLRYSEDIYGNDTNHGHSGDMNNWIPEEIKTPIIQVGGKSYRTAKFKLQKGLNSWGFLTNIFSNMWASVTIISKVDFFNPIEDILSLWFDGKNISNYNQTKVVLVKDNGEVAKNDYPKDSPYPFGHEKNISPPSNAKYIVPWLHACHEKDGTGSSKIQVYWIKSYLYKNGASKLVNELNFTDDIASCWRNFRFRDAEVWGNIDESTEMPVTFEDNSLIFYPHTRKDRSWHWGGGNKGVSGTDKISITDGYDSLSYEVSLKIEGDAYVQAGMDWYSDISTGNLGEANASIWYSKNNNTQTIRFVIVY